MTTPATPDTSLPPLARPIAAEATQADAPPGSATLTQTRLIQAARAHVWTAWTDPAQLGQWWGPKGFSVTTDLFEFRPGGHWVFVMHGPDPDPRSRLPGGPRDFPNHIVFDAIERGDGIWRIEYHHVSADGIEPMHFTTVVTFEDVDGGAGRRATRLVMRADFGTAAFRDQLIRDYGAARGGQETLARLADHSEGEGLALTSAATGHRLMLSRVLPVKRQLLWRAWTEPELLKQWFCPKPYGVDAAVLDLRAGGRMYTHMVGPDGWQADNEGCYLEVVPQERLSFTDLMRADWVPALNPMPGFSATLTLQDLGDGRTRYTAVVRHADAGGRTRHADMGFHDGWGTATDQLLALARSL